MLISSLRPSFAAAVLCLVGPGCASVSPAPAFRETAGLVEARTGRRIQWQRAGDGDEAVGRRVRDLLTGRLGVEDAVAVALLKNPGLRATYEDLSIAQADLVQAGLLRNPGLGGGLLVPLAGDASIGGSVSVSEDFLGVFLLAARKRIAGARLRATELRVADAVLRLAHDVEAAFYALAAAEQVTALRRTFADAADAALDLARRQRDAGNVSELDVVNQDAATAQAQADLAKSEVELVDARESLTRLLGVWGADAAYGIDDELRPPPESEAAPEGIEARAVRRRLDLAAAREDTRAAARALGLTKATRWLGDVAVGGTFERAPERYTAVGPTLDLELPLFDQKQAVVARLVAELRASEAREEALAVAVRSEVRAAQARVESMRGIVERYVRVLVPLRERALVLSQEQYNAMLVGAYQLLQAKQSEVTSRRELIEAIRDYWIARAELERAIGGFSPESSPTDKEAGVRR